MDNTELTFAELETLLICRVPLDMRARDAPLTPSEIEKRVMDHFLKINREDAFVEPQGSEASRDYHFDLLIEKIELHTDPSLAIRLADQVRIMRDCIEVTYKIGYTDLAMQHLQEYLRIERKMQQEITGNA